MRRSTVIRGWRNARRLTQNMSASLRCVWGSRFWVWMKWGNLEGSRMKKTGVLLKTQSRLPSSVLILTAKPRFPRQHDTRTTQQKCTYHGGHGRYLPNQAHHRQWRNGW